MKCPYNVSTTQTHQDTWEYTEGQTTFHQSVLQESHTYGECYHEDCATWIDGKCQYNGDK